MPRRERRDDPGDKPFLGRCDCGNFMNWRRIFRFGWKCMNCGQAKPDA